MDSETIQLANIITWGVTQLDEIPYQIKTTFKPEEGVINLVLIYNGELSIEATRQLIRPLQKLSNEVSNDRILWEGYERNNAEGEMITIFDIDIFTHSE